MKRQMKRWIAGFLVTAMMANITGCAAKTEVVDQATLSIQQPKDDTGVVASNSDDSKKQQKLKEQIKLEERPEEERSTEEDPVMESPVAENIPQTNELQDREAETGLTVSAEYDRDSMEQIVTLLSGDSVSSEEIQNMNEEELSDYTEKLLEELDEANRKKDSDNSNNTAVNVGDHEEDYDENGAMEKPFDQIYPEVVEKEQVAYDDETLLIKMSNQHDALISDGMKSAGVAALEEVVPMEESTWYEAKLFDGTDATEAVQKLRELSEVQMVDYNYEVEMSGMADVESVPEILHNNPHHEKQWHLKYCQFPTAHKEMKHPGGSSNVVVAVIDTGVDYDHEDLSQNIWVNTAETPDNGIDDDGNGYVDDYYGVNIVTGSGNGDDDNGHGTHVAGIIAAQDNKIGVVGLAYNVKVMPIKAAMSSGTFLQSDIAKAILYAYENGAEVINMSFGGSACSIAVQDALETAYSRCVLVASAGNDGYINEGAPGTQCDIIPNYPAALNYVIGVMSVGESGVESGFTNIDGKLYTKSEYEVYAPGEGIMSTIPNNQYASWSGTSMAAPVVSAIAAVLRSEYEDRNIYPTKFIYGQITATSDDTAICSNPAMHGEHNIPNIVNFYDALKKMPTPDVGLYDYALFDTAGLAEDTLSKNNGDGVIDAGETIALGLTLRNRWGLADDTMVTIDTLTSGGVTDPYIEILNPEVNYGAVGTYSTGDCGAIYTDELLTGWENPFYIKIAEDCPNDYIFRLNVTIAASNGLDTTDNVSYVNDEGKVTLTVRSGSVLPSVIEEDMTLTKDSLYIIPNGTTIQAGVTVTVEPGTHIQFWSNDAKDPYADKYIAGLDVKGRLLVKGTAEEPVYIYPSDLMANYNVDIYESENGYVSLKHADITNFRIPSKSISLSEDCIFRQNYDEVIYRYLSSGSVVDSIAYDLGTIDQAIRCVFYKSRSDNEYFDKSLNGTFTECIFVDCEVDLNVRPNVRDCVFLGNTSTGEIQEIGNKRHIELNLNNSETGKYFAKERYNVFYNENTGTTYLYFNPGFAYESYVQDRNFEFVHHLIKNLGGSYAAIETLEEKQWIDETINIFEWRVEIVYDEAKDCYLWANGEKIGEFVDPQGITKGHKNFSFRYKFENKVLQQSDSEGGILYEIPGEVYPEDISLNQYSVDMDMETTYQIIPTATPKTDNFVYESKDEAIVTVSDTGVITPVNNGQTEVYVYSVDKAVFNYITVNVVDYVALEELTFSETDMVLEPGESYQAKCVLTPSNTTRRNVTYTSSDNTVAAVDEKGKVTAVGRGTAVITASAEGLTTSMNVTVCNKATAVDIVNLSLMASLADEVMALPEVTVTNGEDAVLEWKSTDTDVAEVKENGLQLKAEGTTTIIVTDLHSGLSDSVLLRVAEGEIPIIKKSQRANYAGNEVYSLTDGGEVYAWICSSTGDTVESYLSGVVDFDTRDSNAIFLMENGEIYKTNSFKQTPVLLTDYFVGKNAAQVEMYEGSYWVRTQNGTVYSWGKNTYGCLGQGHMQEVGEPTLLNLEGVKEIRAGHNHMAGFLTKDGELYIAGGKTLVVSIPVLYDTEVLGFVSSYNIDGFLKEDKIVTMGDNFIERTYKHNLAEYDSLVDGKSIDLGLKNGMLYSLSGDSADMIPTGVKVIAISPIRDDVFSISTEDGGLYIYENGEFLNIPTVTYNEELKIKESNLEESNILTEEKLILDWNKEITSYKNVVLYADNAQIPVTIGVKYDAMSFSLSSGFQKDVTYRLEIAAEGLTAVGGVTNAEAISLTFTSDYTAPEVEPGEDVEEIIVRESQRDETIERNYWTVETLVDKMQEIYEEEQINPQFYGNVILNRITTDPNPEHWFRVVAPESSTYKELPLGGNYWGTTNATAVGKQIVDYTDYNSYVRLLYDKYLTEAPENTFPFVTDVTVFNKNGEEVNTVGNEEITVKVSFNRDMDTTIPLNVTFGSSYPYADYTIEGTYVDSRTWEGTYTLSTLIEGGSNYFCISNGCSATKDLQLYEDTARFMFTIDNTAAQALIMQGYATDTGIQLSWTQDDFDTLMGYNVYRSTSEDGYYQRLNDTVIPTETKEFFDETVEPGKMYYYNFTVVQTDMKESIPSGKIVIMSKDTMAPDIYHTPLYSAYTGSNAMLSATVTDNLNLTSVKTFYRTTGTEEWNVVMMSKLNDKYSAIIPADALSLEGLEYYIEAYDGINYTYKGSAEVPYAVTIQQALDASALGDVNGDGKISNLDALMVLQAINDKLNLTSEQFTRADLDGNGVLQAFEALRILQYVSGSIGSVSMR